MLCRLTLRRAESRQRSQHSADAYEQDDRGACRRSQRGASAVLTDLLAVGVTYAAVALAAWPLGLYMARVYRGEPTFLSPVMRPVEHGLYRLGRVTGAGRQQWTRRLPSV